ncbi:hypothetical protein T440DRAFT_372243, partial [Plenodomus tracheiphilus IPT5]
MRLLHIEGDADIEGSINLSLCELLGGDVPDYAILSHRWREEEVLYADTAAYDKSIAHFKKGFSTLECFCREVSLKGFSYAWSDTCCIDKSSSAELSEAFNSMYSYYADAQICMAYLDDV